MQCDIIHPASYTDQPIHACQNKINAEAPGLKYMYFLPSFNGPPHPLGKYQQRVFRAVLVLQQLQCYTCVQTGACSAELQQLYSGKPLRVQYSDLTCMLSVHMQACICSLELQLFVVLNTGYREMWSVCVFIKMVIGYNWIHWMRDMTPSTHQ